MDIKKIADAFKELEVIVNTPNSNLPLKQFSDACSCFFLVFNFIEKAFKFAETDYVSKVNDLAEASRSILTLDEMIDKDIEANCVRKVGSHTRNLLRVNRGLEMIRVLCEELISTESKRSLRDSAFKAYNQVFAPHHGWAIQKAAAIGFDSLLSKAQLFRMFSESESKMHIQSYVSTSASVIAYVDTSSSLRILVPIGEDLKKKKLTWP